jgi:hypothetical protein
MKRGGPLKRTGGLKRTQFERQRVQLPKVSAKRKTLNRERVAVVADLRAQAPTCQAAPLLLEALSRMATEDGRRPYRLGLAACRPTSHLVGHEPKKRSRRGSIVDPSNILMVCSPCNAWVEIHVDAATEAGLLVPSTFERDRS